MKLILQGADFSADNIGTTTVPLITTVESQAFFDAVPTSFSAMTDSEKLVINSAIKSMVSSGIYGTKVTNLYLHLPVLDSTERWVNLANPAQTLAYPASGYATFDVNGANPIQGWGTGDTINTRDFHLLTYSNGTTSTTRTNVALGYNSSNIHLGRQIATGNSGLLFTSSNKAQFTGRTSSLGALLGINDYANSKLIAIDSSITEVNSVATGSGTDLGLNLFSHTNGNSSAVPENPVAISGWGLKMTEAEGESYVGIIDTLISGLTS